MSEIIPNEEPAEAPEPLHLPAPRVLPKHVPCPFCGSKTSGRYSTRTGLFCCVDPGCGECLAVKTGSQIRFLYEAEDRRLVVCPFCNGEEDHE